MATKIATVKVRPEDQKELGVNRAFWEAINSLYTRYKDEALVQDSSRDVYEIVMFKESAKGRERSASCGA